MRGRSLTLGFLGVAAAAVGIAVGELIARFINPAYAPIEVIASSAIDVPPAWVKEWATSTFGTSSKTVVVIVVLIAVVILAAIAGVQAGVRIWRGVLIMLVAGFVGVIAGLWRPANDVFPAVPSLVAAVIAALALTLLIRWTRESVSGSTSVNTRRAFLLGGITLVGAGVVGAFARSVYEQSSSVVTQAISKLPIPRETLPPIPATAQAPVPGMVPFVTPNSDFYRIDTTFVIPRVAAADWKLTIDGMVRTPLTVSYEELLALPMVERDVTIMCVSNPIGGDYIGNARWLGTPLMPLLFRAGLSDQADQLFSTSVDGWTCSTPLEGLAEREPLLAIGMNGEPLPADHGFPVRMIVPGLYGFISATKWVTNITATTYAQDEAYWTYRGWATDAPVLTGSRIDLPRGSVAAGPQFIAGVAWAMDGDGVSRVEVRIDDGPWQVAQLADEPSAVTWRQWWMPWDATPGNYRLQVRATNGKGEVQTEATADPIPSGATGLDTRDVTVE